MSKFWRGPCLEQEVEVGNALEHGPQEHGQEGDDVVLCCADGVANIALIDRPRAQPDPPRFLRSPLLRRALLQTRPGVVLLRPRQQGTISAQCGGHGSCLCCLPAKSLLCCSYISEVFLKDVTRTFAGCTHQGQALRATRSGIILRRQEMGD